MANEGEIRILLVGRTGSGISSTANSIMKKTFFTAKNNAISVTDVSKIGETQYEGKKIVVADTPGFFNTNRKKEEVETEIRKTFQLLSPDVILFIISIDRRLLEEDVRIFLKIFGDKRLPYVKIVFTGSSDLNVKSLDVYASNLSEFCKDFFRKCNNRPITINNRGSESEKNNQRAELLDSINNIVETNKRSFYSKELLQEENKFPEIKKHPIEHSSDRDGYRVLNSCLGILGICVMVLFWANKK